MRWVYLTVIVVFATAAIVFMAQNFEVVTVSLFRFSVQTPLSLLIAAMYLLGMVTGTGLFALLSRSIRGAKRPTGAGGA